MRRARKRNGTTILLALLFLVPLSSGQQRNISRPEAQSLRSFTEVKGQPEDLPSSFEFSISGYKYRISSSGHGRRTRGGFPPRSLNLRLGRHDALERAIYHAEYEGDVLLLCEVSDGEGGAGFIARLDGRTLRMKWKRWIPAFNIGQGLIEDDSAYVTAIGFIGKVQLKSGAFVWKHDDLYRGNGTFNSFELPRVDGETVSFKESTIYDVPAKTIEVSRRSGKIIMIR